MAIARTRSEYLKAIMAAREAPPSTWETLVARNEFYLTSILELCRREFDIWACRTVSVVRSDAAVARYDAFLLSYANTFLETYSDRMISYGLPLARVEEMLSRQREILSSCVNRWKADAREQVIKELDGISAAVVGGQPTSADAPQELQGDGGTSGSPATSGAFVFRQASGGLWEVAFHGDRRVGLKKLKGMVLIRTLLASPGVPIDASMLVSDSGAAPTGKDQENRISNAIYEGEIATTTPWDGTPTFDDRALREIRARLKELSKERQAAQESGDEEEEARVDEEYARIERQLKLDVGLGGRTRRMGSEAEKARHAASRRYSTALAYLKKQLPDLAEHLTKCVRPGVTFVYQPPADIIHWLL